MRWGFLGVWLAILLGSWVLLAGVVVALLTLAKALSA